MIVRPVDIFYASKLRQLRDSRGLKQYAAAQLLGISQQEYSDLERGKKKFTDTIISSIFKYFELESETQDASIDREFFRTEIFVKLSDPGNEQRVQHILQLFFKRETILQKLLENDKELVQKWKLLTGDNADDSKLFNYKNRLPH